MNIKEIIKFIFRANGRTGRKEYISRSISAYYPLILVIILAKIVESIFNISLKGNSFVSFLLLFTACWGFLRQYHAVIKRLHDLGKSGKSLKQIFWNPFFGFYLLLKDGQTGPNEYGDEPGN